MTILITGASKGIGSELALQIASEGHKLILIARSEDLLKKVVGKCNKIAATEIAVPIVYDLSNLLIDSQDFSDKIAEITDTVDILVNNAAILIKKPFHEILPREAREVFEANYFAPAELIRICLPLLKNSANPAIINVTSMAAVQGASKFPGLSAYSASKAALAALTECLAVELKEDNIKVNALAFGSVQTEMLAEAFPGLKAPASAFQMAAFFKWFVLEGWKRFNGKMLPVSESTP